MVFFLKATDAYFGTLRQQVLQEVPRRNAVTAVGRPRNPLAQKNDSGFGWRVGHAA